MGEVGELMEKIDDKSWSPGASVAIVTGRKLEWTTNSLPRAAQLQ